MCIIKWFHTALGCLGMMPPPMGMMPPPPPPPNNQPPPPPSGPLPPWQQQAPPPPPTSSMATSAPMPWQQSKYSYTLNSYLFSNISAQVVVLQHWCQMGYLLLQIQPPHPPLPLETCHLGNSLNRQLPQPLSPLHPWAPLLWCRLHLGSNLHFPLVPHLLRHPLHLAQQAWCTHHLPHPHPWTLTLWPWWEFLECHLTGCPQHLHHLLPKVKGYV